MMASGPIELIAGRKWLVREVWVDDLAGEKVIGLDDDPCEALPPAWLRDGGGVVLLGFGFLLLLTTSVHEFSVERVGGLVAAVLGGSPVGRGADGAVLRFDLRTVVAGKADLVAGVGGSAGAAVCLLAWK